MNEVFPKGILDSGCTKTVSGKIMINEYVPILPEKYKKLLVISQAFPTQVW